MKYYGISTGETGQYGVGDLVPGSSYTYEELGEGYGVYYVNGEPCHHVITIVDDKIEYADS